MLDLSQVAYIRLKPVVLTNELGEFLLKFLVAILLQTPAHLNRSIEAISVSLYVSQNEVREIYFPIIDLLGSLLALFLFFFFFFYLFLLLASTFFRFPPFFLWLKISIIRFIIFGGGIVLFLGGFFWVRGDFRRFETRSLLLD